MKSNGASHILTFICTQRKDLESANMRVAAIPDARFVDPQEYEKEADYVIGDLSELPALVRRVNSASSEKYALG
jgi:hypothetical protein